MEGLLSAIEASGPAALLRASFYLYPLVNAGHILAIGVLVTTALLMDLRVLGLGRALSVEVVIAQLRPFAIGALVTALITGGLLFSVRPFEYLGNAAFQIKIILLVIAAANAIAFTAFGVHRSRGVGIVMAISSVALWLGVLTAGRFIGFLE